MKKFLLLLACAVFVAAGGLVTSTRGNADSGSSDKHEQLYRHGRSKEILPFKDILKAVRPFIQGEIIETEFENEHGIPTYEFKYIDKSGRVREMYVNAKTGKIIKDEED